MTRPWAAARHALLVAGMIVLTAGAMALGGGRPFLALVPPLLVLVGWAMWRLPLRISATALLFCALLFDAPSERPMMELWASPLTGPGRLLYSNLNTSLGLSPLHFSGMEVLLVAFLLVWGLRRLRGDEPPLLGGTRPVAAFVALILLAVVGLEAWGLARGGSFRQSLWQMRQLLWLGPLTLLFASAFRGDLARRNLLVLIGVVALIRAAFGIYFEYAIARPQGLSVTYVTTHADSVLFVVAMLLVVQGLLESPGKTTLAAAAVILPVVGWALVLNNRRLAFVTLALSLFAMPFVLRPGLRRRTYKLLSVLGPLLAIYAAVGWESQAAFFQPVAAIRSASDDENRSTLSRDIEDQNLSRTAWASPVIGQGLGHPYQEFVKGDDISHIFEQYRYLPHNSVLWLFSAGGFVGFVLVWIFLPVAVFLAMRANLAARTTVQHVLAVGAVFAVIAYSAQAFGDIGMQAWRPTFLLAAFVGAAASLAAETGAWRAGAHLMGTGRARPPVGATPEGAP